MSDLLTGKGRRRRRRIAVGFCDRYEFKFRSEVKQRGMIVTH